MHPTLTIVRPDDPIQARRPKGGIGASDDYDDDDIRMVNHDIWMANHAVGLTRKGINSPASQVDTEKMKPNYSCGQPPDSQG